jgi:FlaG/FlaF family flagellin (archaellin)
MRVFRSYLLYAGQFVGIWLSSINGINPVAILLAFCCWQGTQGQQAGTAIFLGGPLHHHTPSSKLDVIKSGKWLLSSSFLPVFVQLNEVQKIMAADGEEGGAFGYSVASDSNTLIVGAPNSSGPGGWRQGGVYVFSRSDTLSPWVLQQKLVAPDGSPVDNFGGSVAISGDTLVVGAIGVDGPAGYDTGAAYVFARSGGGTAPWSFQQRLTAGDAADRDQFGSAVAINADSIFVGAHFGDGPISKDQGSVYVFGSSGQVSSPWVQLQKLTADDGSYDDRFGWQLAAEMDTLVVGAFFADSPSGNTGAVYVFTRSVSGTPQWSQQQKLVPEPSSPSSQKYFGFSVAISGNIIVVGAPYESGETFGEGAAYIFVNDVSSALPWVMRQKLVASDSAMDDSFGWSVSVSGDTIGVGAIYDSELGIKQHGSAYIFTPDGSNPALWEQVQKLTASDAAAIDAFGATVTVSNKEVFVFAPNADGTASHDQGAVYVFASYTSNSTSSPTGSLSVPKYQEAGSVLVFPYYASAADGSFTNSDTLIQITNACNGPALSANGAPNYSFLHLFFINGANCSPADTFVCLTPSGSIQIKASDYDPTVTGYLIAVAVDANGAPTQNNCFIGSAFVRDDDAGIIDSYGAEAFWKLTPGAAPVSGGIATINLNGVDYDAAPIQFSVQVQDLTIADESIILASLSGDLGTQLGSTLQVGPGVLYRADETPASFQPQIGSGCFSVTAVDKSKIRVVPGTLDTFLKNSYGYLKFQVSAPAVGLLLSRQAPANQAANRWSGIRTLHKTQVGSATLTARCFPPFCGF